MGIKISELTELEEANGNDVLPIVDSVSGGTKKLAIKNFLSLIFPVGSTYITQNTTNPNTILGFGTWERLKGKVCLGLDEDDANFNTIGKTGGESKHVLTINEIPSHDHNSNVQLEGRGSEEWSIRAVQQYIGGKVSTSTTGGGQAHNNLQPYEVVGYMWIRRA